MKYDMKYLILMDTLQSLFDSTLMTIIYFQG